MPYNKEDKDPPWEISHTDSKPSEDDPSLQEGESLLPRPVCRIWQYQEILKGIIERELEWIVSGGEGG